MRMQSWKTVGTNNDKSNVQPPKRSMNTKKKNKKTNIGKPIIVHYYGLIRRMVHFKPIDEAGHLKRRNYAILWMIWSIWSFSSAVCADNKPLSLLSPIAERYSTNLRIHIIWMPWLTPFIFPFSTIDSTQFLFFLYSHKYFEWHFSCTWYTPESIAMQWQHVFSIVAKSRIDNSSMYCSNGDQYGLILIGSLSKRMTKEKWKKKNWCETVINTIWTYVHWTATRWKFTENFATTFENY